MPAADVPLSPAMKLVVIAIVAIGLVPAIILAIKAWLRPPLVQYEPRKSVPWGANDLVLVVLCVFLLGYAGGEVMARLNPPPNGNAEGAAAYYANAIVELIGVGLAIYLMRLQAGATLIDLGFGVRRLARDLGVGAVALLASVVPIYGMQELLPLLFKKYHYTHAVIQSLQAHPDAAMFIATGIAAIVAAPFFEELVFRVLLQGWLERIEARRRVLRLGLPGEGPAWWPIVLSSLLWAAMHWNNGLAVIPLFFFGLVLGYLYQRSHRIWPSLTTHCLLNTATMIIVWTQLGHAAA